MRHWLNLLIALPTMLSLNCGESPCYGELKTGSHVSISVVGAYDANSQFVLAQPYDPLSPPTCEFGFDLMPGQVLDGTIVGLGGDDNTCEDAFLSIQPFGTWTWTLDGDRRVLPGNSAVPLGGEYVAQSGSCRGTTSVAIYDPDGHPFDKSIPGQVPHAVLWRTFTPEIDDSSETSCSTCFGLFVVDVQLM
jgi:hypothetical protein